MIQNPGVPDGLRCWSPALSRNSLQTCLQDPRRELHFMSFREKCSWRPRVAASVMLQASQSLHLKGSSDMCFECSWCLVCIRRGWKKNLPWLGTGELFCAGIWVEEQTSRCFDDFLVNPAFICF